MDCKCNPDIYNDEAKNQMIIRKDLAYKLNTKIISYSFRKIRYEIINIIIFKY